MKKKLSFLLSIVLSFSIFSGCAENTAKKNSDLEMADSYESEGRQSSNDSLNQTGADTFNTGDISVGISMPAKNLERWNHDGYFLKTQFENRGYKVELSFADNSYKKQNSDIEKMISDKVDLLIVSAVDATALSRVMSEAKENGIQVIAYDRLIMGTDAITYNVSFDNYMVGQMQGQFVVDSLGLDNSEGPFNIEFVEGDAGDNNATLYYNGEYDVLKPYIESGKVSVLSGQKEYCKALTEDWSTDNAKNRLKNIFSSFYSDGTRLDAIVCSNDSTALGAVEAVDSFYKGDNSVIITGQDGDEKNLAAIIDGKQSMTVFKALANEAVVTVDLSDSILKGNSPNQYLISDSDWDFECTYDTVSYDNGTGVIPSYLLKPVVVTKENMNEVLVEPGYYTVDGDGYLHSAY